MGLFDSFKKFLGIKKEPITFPKRDEFGRWVDDSPKAKPANVKVELVPATTGTKPTDIPREVIKPSQSTAKKPKPNPTAKAAPATATAKKKPSATVKKKPKPKA